MIDLAETCPDRIEARIRLLEDRAEIFQLMAAYGPSDAMDAETLGALWTDDANYKSSGHVLAGREGIVGPLESPIHRDFVATGSAHVISLPRLEIDGDGAMATGHSRVYLRDGEGHSIARVSANRRRIMRAPAGWRVAHRLNRRITGEDAPRAVLAQK